MWLCTKIGFYSIVRKGGGWHVRARRRDDLRSLCRLAGLHRRIRYWPDADYPWRIIIQPPELHGLMHALVLTLDYPNFKAMIARGHQADKLPAYARLHAELARLSERPFRSDRADRADRSERSDRSDRSD